MVRLPVVREASLGAAAPVYERYRPEHTLLYQLVEEITPRSRPTWRPTEAHCRGTVNVKQVVA